MTHPAIALLVSALLAQGSVLGFVEELHSSNAWIVAARLIPAGPACDVVVPRGPLEPWRFRVAIRDRMVHDVAFDSDTLEAQFYVVRCTAASPGTDGWSLVRVVPDPERMVGVHLARSFFFKAFDPQQAPRDSAGLIRDWARLGEPAALPSDSS
jgi:hypothetical protein